MDYRMGTVEARFAELIWENEPVASGQLVKLCEAEFGWKKSTTYTVLKRLCEKQIFTNQGGCVTSLLSREEFYSAQSRQIVEENFKGSLPSFIAAFTRSKKLSRQEAEEILRMIEDAGEE